MKSAVSILCSVISISSLTFQVARSQEKESILAGHKSVVTSVAFSSDGTTLASSSDDRTVKLWDLATGKNILTFRGHSDTVMAVAFTPNGRTVASASLDKTLLIWEASTGKVLGCLKGH